MVQFSLAQEEEKGFAPGMQGPHQQDCPSVCLSVHVRQDQGLLRELLPNFSSLNSQEVVSPSLLGWQARLSEPSISATQNPDTEAKGNPLRNSRDL